MNDGYIKLKVLDWLLVFQRPLPTALIAEYAGNDYDRLEELRIFIDKVESIDTPLSIKQLAALTGLPRQEIQDIENEGITNLTKKYK